MGNRAYALMTGLFVVVLGTAFATAAWWIAGQDAPHDPYVVVARSDITGLREASPVLYRGVTAGRVESIGFNPEDFQEILIRVELRSALPVGAETYATLRPQGITGLSQLVLHNEGAVEEPLETTPDHPPRIPLEPGFLDELAGSGESLLSRLDALATKLNALLDEENQQRAGNLLANLERVSEGLVTAEERVLRALETVPSMGEEVERTLAETRTLVEGMQGLPPRLERLAEEASTLLERGHAIGREVDAEMTPALTRLLDELAGASRELRRTARTLGDHPESLLRGRPRRAPGPGEQGYEGGAQ